MVDWQGRDWVQVGRTFCGETGWVMPCAQRILRKHHRQGRVWPSTELLLSWVERALGVESENLSQILPQLCCCLLFSTF